MASDPITSWQIDRQKMEKVTDFFSWAPKSLWMMTAGTKCLKMFVHWKKSYEKPRQSNKNRDITLPTKVHAIKAMVFPIVMYGYESWTIKKAEHRRIYTFEFWCWRRLLHVPLDIKEIQPVNPKGNQP